MEAACDRLLWSLFGPATKSYCCAKFGCDRCSSFHDMKVDLFFSSAMLNRHSVSLSSASSSQYSNTCVFFCYVVLPSGVINCKAESKQHCRSCAFSLIPKMHSFFTAVSVCGYRLTFTQIRLIGL